MSIRNLSNNQTKDWLDGKFDHLNARQLAFIDGDRMIVDGDIELKGSVGTIGQKFKKDSSNDPAWITKSTFGDVQYHFVDHNVTPFTTSTTGGVLVSTFTTPAPLPAGTYVFQYFAEFKNSISFDGSVDIDNTTLAVQFNQIMNRVINEYSGGSGFKVEVLGAPATHTVTFTVFLTVGTSSVKNVRLVIYRLL